MKKTMFIIMTLAFIYCLKAQDEKGNPFAEYGYKPKVVTLTQGQYDEFFETDRIIQLGSVLFDTNTNKVVAFAEEQELVNESDLKTTIVSRFMSPDPLTADFPSWSPYPYAMNQPIWAIDLDGLERYIVIRELYEGILLRTYVVQVPNGDRIIDQAENSFDRNTGPVTDNTTVAIVERDTKNKSRLDRSIAQAQKNRVRRTLIREANAAQNKGDNNIKEFSELTRTERTVILAKENSFDRTGREVARFTSLSKATIRFDADKSGVEDIKDKLSAEGIKNLQNQATVAKGLGVKIVIQGIASPIPTTYIGKDSAGKIMRGELNMENNLLLARDRAQAAKDLLISEYGVPEELIEIKTRIAPKQDTLEKDRANQKTIIGVDLDKKIKKP